VGGTELAFLVAGITCMAMTAFSFVAWPRHSHVAPAEPVEQRLAA